MKLVRFGPAGKERPGLVDKDGVVRDLSGEIADLDPSTLDKKSLTRLAALDVEALPAVSPSERLGPCVGHPGSVQHGL